MDLPVLLGLGIRPHKDRRGTLVTLYLLLPIFSLPWSWRQTWLKLFLILNQKEKRTKTTPDLGLKMKQYTVFYYIKCMDQDSTRLKEAFF